MRKTKIVCTIGPASDKYDILRELIEKGMNVMRLNFPMVILKSMVIE